MSTVHICRPGLPIVEVKREHWENRWCFACRGRHDFDFVVRDFAESDVDQLLSEVRSGQRPEDDLWILARGEPIPSIECAHCGQTDGDIGFGGVREWHE